MGWCHTYACVSLCIDRCLSLFFCYLCIYSSLSLSSTTSLLYKAQWYVLFLFLLQNSSVQNKRLRTNTSNGSRGEWATSERGENFLGNTLPIIIHFDICNFIYLFINGSLRRLNAQYREDVIWIMMETGVVIKCSCRWRHDNYHLLCLKLTIRSKEKGQLVQCCPLETSSFGSLPNNVIHPRLPVSRTWTISMCSAHVSPSS